MSLFIWYGLGDGVKASWIDGRNWLDENGEQYAEARYPGSDAGVYDDTLWSGPLGSGAASPAGIDLSAKVDLKSLRVEATYNGSIGEAGTPITVAVQHDTSPGYADSEIVIDGRSSQLIHLKGKPTATYGLRRVTVTNAANTGLYLDGKMDLCHLLRGKVGLKANVEILTDLFVGFIAQAASDVVLTIPSDDTISLPSTINVSGGQISNGQPFTTINFYGGSWVHSVAGATTRLNQHGGTFDWQKGEITYIHAHSGLLDAAAPCDEGRDLTELHVYPNAVADLRNALRNNRIAEGGFIQNWGGTLKLTPGQKMMLIP